MNHEVRHIATCTCGRTIEVIIRTPRKETGLLEYGKEEIDAGSKDEKAFSGMLPGPLFRT